MRRAGLLPLSIVLCGCAGTNSLLRIAENGSDKLEVAWVRFSPPPGRPPVTLVTTVHVAEPAFFSMVQRRLDRTPVVLMEGIIAEPSREESDGGIAAQLHDVATQLRLVHQVDALEFRPGWVRADVTEGELRQMLAAEPVVAGDGPSFEEFRRDVSFTLFQYRLAHPELEPRVAEDRVRGGTARERYAELILERASDPPPQPVLIDARNAVALESLVGRRPEEEVVLCWGYAHGPDFIQRLTVQGYEVAELTWHTVFSW